MNRAWRACSKPSAPMFTQKEPTTRRKPFRSVPSRNDSAPESPSLEIRKSIRPTGCSNPSSRRRMAERRFLVLRLGSLGDIVHTFPAVAGLRDSFPQAEITWLTHPRWSSLVESSSLTSQVSSVESRSLASVAGVVRRLRQAHWDAAIDYQGLWKTALLPLMGKVKRRIGFSSATIREFAVPLLYTDRVHCKTAHIADQNGE